MILITGATGTVGRELVRQLMATGTPFMAMVRDQDKAHRVLGTEPDIIYGDFMRPETLDTAFQEATKLFLLAPSNEFQVQMENNAVDAAVRAGVDHIVKLSVLGATPYSDIGFLRWHYLVEKYIKDAGVPYTFLRPNTFMQNLLRMAPSIISQGKFHGATHDGEVSFIDVRDVASVAATALMTDTLADRTFDLTGPEAITLHDAALALSDAMGRRIEYVDLPLDEYQKGMMDAGLPEWQAEDYAQFERMESRSLGAVVTPDVARVLGRDPISIERFARDYAQAFEQARAA